MKRVYKCDICKAEFKQKTSLNEHTISKHSTTKIVWLCPYGCHKIFSLFLGVVRHIKLDKTCPARLQYFKPEFHEKLKKNFDHKLMNEYLQKEFNIENDADKVNFSGRKITAKYIQENIRNTTMSIFSHYIVESDDEEDI